MITIVLADDHPVFAAGLRAVFDAEDDLEVLAVAATGRAALDGGEPARARRRRARPVDARRRRAVGLRRSCSARAAAPGC